MKRKLFSKSLAMLMVLVLALSVATVVSFAENAATGNADALTFNTYVTVDANAPVPATTFTFDVAAGSAVAGTSTTYEIIPGPTPANVVVSDAVFTGSESTTAGTPSGADATKKYAVKEVNVDLSGVTFTAPGVYRYIISEAEGSRSDITYDTAARYLDVFVTTDGNDLSVERYILTDTAADRNLADTTVADKSTGVKNSMTSFDLTFSKSITGNQADKTASFPFVLSISNAVDGTYTVSDGSTITVSDGVATANFSLSNGDTITVYGLNPGASCTVSETAGDYTPTVSVDSAAATQTNSATVTMNDDHSLAFTNTRDGVIPTGVILTVAPFAIGLLVAGAVIIFLMGKKRKKEF